MNVALTWKRQARDLDHPGRLRYNHQPWDHDDGQEFVKSSRSFFYESSRNHRHHFPGCFSPRFLLRVLSIVDLKDSPQSGVYARLQPRDLCESYRVIQCTMLPLSTKSCLKSSKLRPILNGQFCHAIFKNICLKVLGSKQPWEILVFVIFKL